MVPVIILTVIGVVIAVAIGLVAKYFGQEQDPRAEKLLEFLPGANCGACGFAGCADYVKAMLDGSAKPGLCVSMTEENIAEAAKLLGGIEVEHHESKIAVVCCKGSDDVAASRAFYNGVTDCVNAMIVANGGKTCTYGCLGLGTCARACPFGAIEITQKHLAIVHSDLCKGCGKCVAACPRHVIKLVPKSANVHVFCNSPENFKFKKTACKAACIGCKKCAKGSEEGQVEFQGFLARINYDNPPSEHVVDECPAHAMGRNVK